MKNRIQQFLQVENKSSAQFAEEIGVQPSSVSHIISGRNNPSLDFILKMLAKYPDLATEWLLFGKGAMYKSSKTADLFAETPDNVEDRVVKTAIPEISAGFAENRDNSLSSSKRSQPADKEGNIERIVLFFDDGSFSEHSPRD